MIALTFPSTQNSCLCHLCMRCVMTHIYFYCLAMTSSGRMNSIVSLTIPVVSPFSWGTNNGYPIPQRLFGWQNRHLVVTVRQIRFTFCDKWHTRNNWKSCISSIFPTFCWLYSSNMQYHASMVLQFLLSRHVLAMLLPAGNGSVANGNKRV